MAQARKPTKLVFKPTAPANVPALEEREEQETEARSRDTMKCGGSGCGALDGVDVKGWVPGQ